MLALLVPGVGMGGGETAVAPTTVVYDFAFDITTVANFNMEVTTVAAFELDLE